MFSTVRGISVLLKNTINGFEGFSTLGDTFNNVENIQYLVQYCEGYHQYCAEYSVLWRDTIRYCEEYSVLWRVWKDTISTVKDFLYFGGLHQ